MKSIFTTSFPPARGPSTALRQGPKRSVPIARRPHRTKARTAFRSALLLLVVAAAAACDPGDLVRNQADASDAVREAQGQHDAGPEMPPGEPNQPPRPPVGFADFDEDGIADTVDNCLDTANPDQRNTDRDPLGNACDADDDNDGILDEADCDPENETIGLCSPFYADLDGDGFGNPEVSTCACAPSPEFPTPRGMDCDDDNFAIQPGAMELCDGIDQNCNEVADEGFVDADGDGIAGCVDEDENRPPSPIDAPDFDGDGIADTMDNCAAVPNPDQLNTDADPLGNACDADDDNDGVADENDCAVEDPRIGPCTLFYADQDEDGFGDPSVSTCACGPTLEFPSADANDCDDQSREIHPGAAERCDGDDQNCNGLRDESFDDTDGDGTADCVDADRDGDGVDNDEDLCPDSRNVQQLDTDGDGLGNACDDDDDGDWVPDESDNCPMTANAGQVDSNGNGRGDACDDDWDDDTIPNDQDNCPEAANRNQNDTDGDAQGDACDVDDDGDGSADDEDCEPLDSTIHPGAVEVCDQIDNDCSGQTDDGVNREGCSRFFIDADNDGFGDENRDGQCLCQPTGEYRVDQQGDCDDLVEHVNPDREDVCNNVDDDCNGRIDEGYEPQKGQSCDTDRDADLCEDGTMVCADDERSLVCDDDVFSEEKTEVCDGIDNDCDGSTDETWADRLDTPCVTGVGVCQQPGTWQCNRQQNGTSCGAVRRILPSRETCDGRDNDCDGQIDEHIRGVGEECAVHGGLGLCATGVFACSHGQQVCEPSVRPGENAETCNRIDDDCDGNIDERAPGQVAPLDRHERNDSRPWENGRAPNAGMVFNRDVRRVVTPQFSTNFHAGDPRDCFTIQDIDPYAADSAFSCRISAPQGASVRLQMATKAPGQRVRVERESDALRSGMAHTVQVPALNGLRGHEYMVCVTPVGGFTPCNSGYRLECTLGPNPAPFGPNR